MVKLLIDLLEFLRGCAPLLFSVCILALLSVLFAKSIRKHATVYYIIFSIPFILVVVPFICRLFGVEVFNFNQIPFLSAFTRDYIHMATFGHPLLIIIMYTGALDPKMQFAKKLYSIRKELSIISGFPVLTHSLLRVTNTFPRALKFFTNNADYMANAKVTSELGAGISNFSFVVGILLFVIFIPLWVTSFDSVHRRMGNVKWKKLQKWAYVLYAILFIHAMGMQIGSLMNPRGKNAPQQQQVLAKDSEAPKRNNEAREAADKPSYVNRENKQSAGEEGRDKALQAKNAPQQQQVLAKDSETPKRNDEAREAADKSSYVNRENKQSTGEEGRNKALQAKNDGENKQPQQIKNFTDIKVSSTAKGYIHIFSLLLIYGSYLFLKIRKEKKKKNKKRLFSLHK